MAPKANSKIKPLPEPKDNRKVVSQGTVYVTVGFPLERYVELTQLAGEAICSEAEILRRLTKAATAERRSLLQANCLELVALEAL
jgi:hypothetical protein